MEASIALYNAQSRRLSLLLRFLENRCLVMDPESIDPDVITAHNLAIEAVLKTVRQLANEACTISVNSLPSGSSKGSATSPLPVALAGPALEE